jgi:hypothetical protein
MSCKDSKTFRTFVSLVMVVSMVNLVMAHVSRENEEMDFEDIGTVEGFMKNKEFRVQALILIFAYHMDKIWQNMSVLQSDEQIIVDLAKSANN